MRKILFAVIAISAIALSSCTPPTRVDILNSRNQVSSDGYSQGSREQTETGNITFTGTIDGQFLDADMVPVRLCDGQIVWAKFHDDLYKVGVEANQAVAKGNRVEVLMREAAWWQFWNWRRFEIVSISITPKQQPAEVCRPDKEPAPTPAVRVRVPVRKSIPVVKTVQQPCCCGTNITITGNSGVITIGAGKMDPVVGIPQKLPIIHDPMEEMKKIRFDNKRDSLRD